VGADERDEIWEYIMDKFYKPFNYKETQSLGSILYFLQRKWAVKSDELNNNKMYTTLKNVCPYPRFTQICGGPNIYFPISEKQNVLMMMAADIQQGKAGYFNQIAYNAPGEGFRLAVDLDAEDRVMTPQEIIKMASVLDKVLCRYYEGKSIPIFVATSGPKWKNGYERLSVHMVAHVQVSYVEARQILFSYQLALSADDQVNMKGLTLDDGIYKDKNAKVPFESVNLRMVYSHKKEKCFVDQPTHEHCVVCDGTSHVTCLKPYEPSFVFYQGKLDKDYFKATHDNFFNILKHHSLWVDEERDVVSGYAIPHGILPYESEEKFEQDVLEGKMIKNSKKRKNPEETKADSPMAKRFQDFLRKITYQSKMPFEHIQVRCMTEYKTATTTTLTIYVKGLGAGHCLYKQKDHGDGRIFFTYDPKKFLLVQRCFSNKYKECEDQKCKDKRIEFVVDPWVYSGADPKQLPRGTHNATYTALVSPAVFTTTQVLDADTSLATLMRLAFENPTCQYRLKSNNTT
jgi:hypothetical protein